MKDYVKCLECETESAREDTYLDIPLPIRPFGSSTAFKSLVCFSFILINEHSLFIHSYFQFKMT